METKFDYAVCSRNEYYHGYLLTLETAAYREGHLPGTNLHMQLVRMNHYYLVQDYYYPVIFQTIEAARDWAVSHGYTFTETDIIYHQSGDILYKCKTM